MGTIIFIVDIKFYYDYIWFIKEEFPYFKILKGDKMNSKIDVDTISALQRICRKKEWTVSFFEWAAGRGKDANVTSIERIEALTGIGYYDIITLARELEELGLVKFISGRKGFKSRIEWYFSVRNIGAAALGAANEVGNVAPDAEDDEVVEASITTSNDDVDNSDIQHSYSLRPNKVIKIALPEDFTKKEAERLAAFINTLPFEI